MTGAPKILTINKLGKGFVASLVLAALITIVTSWYLVQQVTNLNTSWVSHERGITQKQAYLSLLRGTIGYGGMIHNFKNYLLRQEAGDLLAAHESILEVKIVISGYRVLGVSEAEEDALGDLEAVVEAYRTGLTRAEALININYSAAKIDQQINIDDTPAVRALLRLTNAVAAIRQAKADDLSGEIGSLASTINTSATGIGFLLVVLILILAWFLRTRLINPLAKLVAAFDRVDPGQPGQTRLPAVGSGGDELNMVAAAGNRFLDAVDRHLLERQNAETTLRENEAFISAVIGSMVDGVITIDGGGTIISINKAAEVIFGYSPDEMLGNNVNMLMPNPYHDEHDGYLANYRNGGEAQIIGKSREVRGLRKDGSQFPLSLSVSEVITDGGRHYSGIVRDISERKQAEESLRLAKAEAEKANDAKSEFLSSMSHELRTPLHAILGFGQMLETDTATPLTDVQERCVNRIMKGGRHLLELINMVLDLAKIEVGHVGLSIEDVSASEVVGECLDMIRNMADARHLEIFAPKPDQTKHMIRADRTRLHQVMLNLLSNAVKYNRDGGSITIGITQTPGGRLSISVTDTGHGVPKDQMDKLFEPFNRLSAEGSEIEGTGIGLTVTRKLVELMSGTITFESEVGTGSTVSVEFRLADEDANEGKQAATATAPAGQPVHMLENAATLLYVEDNPANMELMEMIVARIDGLTLIQAPNAELGLELARSKKPDLIILDINLPGMSGLEALEKLRLSRETADIPVYALSATATRRDIEKGLEAGFLEYLTKPIELEDTLAIIKRIAEAAS